MAGRFISVFLRENEIIPTCFIVTSFIEEPRKILDIPVLSSRMAREKVTSRSAIIIAVTEKSQASVIKSIEESLSLSSLDRYTLSDKELDEIRDFTEFKNKYGTENNINVLIYHRVFDLPLDTRNLCISPKIFEEQLVFLKENYRILRSDENWDTDEKCVVLTFDDGYFDFRHNIVPLLEKYEVPATVFIATDFIDTDREIWGDELERFLFFTSKSEFVFKGNEYSVKNHEEKIKTLFKLRTILKAMPEEKRENNLSELRMLVDSQKKSRDTHRIMTTDEIIECSKSRFVTIGAHTSSHCCLASEILQVQNEKIAESKRKLEEIIQREVDVFAYPYGQKEDFTDDTAKLAIDMGFKRIFAAYAGLTGKAPIKGKIPRNCIADCSDIAQVARRMAITECIYGNDYI